MTGRGKGEAGFTLPEVMVAALVLVVSILSTAMLADVGSQMTTRAEAQSAATSISRAVSEAARSLTTNELSQASLLNSLKAAAPNLPDSTPADAPWTVEHRGATYVVNVNTCTVDDPSDGHAAASKRDASWCSQPDATNPADTQPDDYRRVNVSVEHGRLKTARVRAVTTISSGLSSSLPLITDLKMRTGSGGCSTECPQITSQTQTSAMFDATTINDPAIVNWLIDGRNASSCPPATETCTGSQNAWAFQWNLGAVPKDTATTVSVPNSVTNPNLGHCVKGPQTMDGVYRVGVNGQDRNGATGGAASLSIVVNRCAPVMPPGFNATGRDATVPVDIEWQDNSEGDILGYRVYRGTSVTQRTAVCPPTPTLSDPKTDIIPIDAPNECLDASPPAYASGTPVYYGVYAVDRDAAGNLREGAVSFRNVNSGNQRPNPPSGFNLAKSGGAVTLTWTIPATQDPDTGDRYESFRIYRRDSAGAPTNPALADRYDRNLVRALCTGTASGSTCSWVDPKPMGASQTYWITAVDTRLRESAYSAGKSA